MAIQSVNPTTEEVIATYEEFTARQIDDALGEAAGAFEKWRRLSVAGRSACMRQAAGYLRAQKERFARLITLEMGKPISQAEAEIEKCAWNCDYYAESAAGYLAERPIQTNARESYVAFEPLGVVLAVMPWNFPFWQVFRFAAPALMAGNTAVLKHASNVPQCALAIEEIFQESGFPAGTFRTLLASSGQVAGIIADERVRAVTLTGSDLAGANIAETAGRNLKKTVLELGGSDAFIVLADADLADAAHVGALARNQNTGQSCIAAKRFIVEDAVADEFERRLTDEVVHLKVGDPMERDTHVGPLARGDLRDGVERQVRMSVNQGARVAVGGQRLSRGGYFYAPTILTEVSESMPVLREETFGPIAAVLRVPDAETAIASANDSVYGLGASLWTANLEQARHLARRIETGVVFVNGMVASDPRLPFGGIRRSGYGRELGEFGIHEFTNIQTVWIGPARGEDRPKPHSE
ncbi:MAG: aldehyde dehydrogenase family protein [Chloroflexi bacterium]|nr:aldehyde dehydrogenase family protein [Chloroflexota bacterium]